MVMIDTLTPALSIPPFCEMCGMRARTGEPRRSCWYDLAQDEQDCGDYAAAETDFNHGLLSLA